MEDWVFGEIRDYVLKETDFFPPAGKERDITHFYAASMAKGKKSVNLFFSLITRGEVENQYRSDKNVIT